MKTIWLNSFKNIDLRQPLPKVSYSGPAIELNKEEIDFLKQKLNITYDIKYILSINNKKVELLYHWQNTYYSVQFDDFCPQYKEINKLLKEEKR